MCDEELNLKPCPACGNKDIILIVSRLYGGWKRIYKNKCYYCEVYTREWAETEADADKLWNEGKVEIR